MSDARFLERVPRFFRHAQRLRPGSETLLLEAGSEGEHLAARTDGAIPDEGRCGWRLTFPVHANCCVRYSIDLCHHWPECRKTLHKIPLIISLNS